MSNPVASIPSAVASRGGPGPATLADVRAALGAGVLWCHDLDAPVAGVVVADLMSDVLVDGRPGFVLLTGLTTVQTIRTAAIADLAGVVFARGKAIPQDIVALAQESKMPVFTTERSLFEAAGALYAGPAGPVATMSGRTGE